MTSQWTPWRLKSPASPLFTQPFILGEDQRKHQSSASLAFCAGNSPGTGEFPAQMASYADFFSIWWRHHGRRDCASHLKMKMKSTDEFQIFTLVSVTSLTHWGRVTHICVSEQTIIGSDNALSPGRRQAIIWTNDGILLIEPLGTNFGELPIEILLFSFKKMRLKVSSAKWRLFPLGLNVLKIGLQNIFPSHCCHLDDNDTFLTEWVSTFRVLNKRNIQLSVVITRSNTTCFCIGYDNDWGKICIRGNVHITDPIARPHGRAMGCLCEDLGENWPRYNGTALYMAKSLYKLKQLYIYSSLRYKSEYILCFSHF